MLAIESEFVIRAGRSTKQSPNDMKLLHLPFLFAVLATPACDQTDVKKEAYDQGFADGQASVKAQAVAAAAARATPRPVAQVTPVPQITDPQVRRVLPNSKLQGTLLDQKPKRN
jgi:hypothetical protein